jgi:hypothetical protein
LSVLCFSFIINHTSLIIKPAFLVNIPPAAAQKKQRQKQKQPQEIVIGNWELGIGYIFVVDNLLFAV